MKKIYYILIILIIFIPLASADTIYLKSGKEVKGKIIEESDKYLRVEVGGVVLRYYLDEIGKVEKDISPNAEVFTLKPSPLILPNVTQEKAAPKTQTAPLAKIIDEPKVPAEETVKLPTPTPASDNTIDPKDRLAIEKIIKEYLNLVSKPLPKDRQEKKQRLQQLSRLFDLNNMPVFLFFREILEKEPKNNYTPVEGDGSVEDKFLESEILGFQKRYLVENKSDMGDFKITEIYSSKERNQATALVNTKNKVITIKLQNKDSDWLINSAY